jgi:hypothetical protein
MQNIENGIYNAKITNVKICTNQHNFLTIIITLDCGNFTTSFGNFGLSSMENPREDINKDNWKVGYTIKRIMEICEVSDFFDIEGSFIKIHIDDGVVKGMCNILKDTWFYPIKEMFSNKKY